MEYIETQKDYKTSQLMETDLGERINPPQIQIYELASMSPEDRDRIMQRSNVDLSKAKARVLPTIDDIRSRGDSAVIDYTEKWDKVLLTPEELLVSDDEIEEAYERIDPVLLEAIKKQIELSKKFHEAQYEHIDKKWEVETAPGVIVEQRITPIESVALYVPGGSAPFPSVAQTLVTAASVAGVERIVVATPPRKDMDAVIVASALAGATEIYRVGGVAAIAALTYGTETIKPVDKIEGPGAINVSAAKSLVSDDVDTGMKAGPSEVLVIADEEANPAYCAADMLSASEHGPESASVLVTWDRGVAEKVQEEIAKQVVELKRREDAEESLRQYSGIILVYNEEEAIEFANEYAPEHLGLMTKDAENLADKVRNVGSITVGEWASKAVVDFGPGSNHIIPTGGEARTSSPIGVESFMKRTEVHKITEEGLIFLAPTMRTIADFEGFDGHRESFEKRIK